MKRIIKYSVMCTLAGTIALSQSCSDFLEVSPGGKLTEDQVYEGDGTSQSIVLGLYNDYRNIIKDRQGMKPWWGTDEVQQGQFQLVTEADQGGFDEYNSKLHPSNAQLNDIWGRRWPTVVSAARIVYKLSEQDNVQETSLAEARFIRGLVMFELAMWFGEIPVYEMEDDGTGMGVLVSKYGTGRQSLDIVWKQIIDDFIYASDKLPETWGETFRATKGAALTMLGKAYMSAPASTNLRDFTKADKCFTDIIAMGRYRLNDSYNGLWDNTAPPYTPPNTAETIFLVDFNNGSQRNMWQFSIGSRVVDGFGTGFGQGCYFDGYDAMVPTPFMYRMKNEPVVTEASQYLAGASQKGIWEEGDLRREASLRYDFSRMVDGVLVVPDYSKAWWTHSRDELDPHIKKHEDYRTDTGSGLGYNNMWESGKVFPALRYADVLLMHAECLNELGQTAEAMNVVNDQVRTRAWGGSLPAEMRWSGLSQQQFRDEIMDERMRELCFEGHRRTDLIRTGRFVELVKERNRWANAAGTINENHMRYPIPLAELQSNPDMTEADQNPGYIN